MNYKGVEQVIARKCIVNGRMTKSEVLVESACTSGELFNELKKVIDPKDTVVVRNDIYGNWAGQNVPPDVKKMLDRRKASLARNARVQSPIRSLLPKPKPKG